MLVGWRAAFVASLGACATGVVSLDACATAPPVRAPVPPTARAEVESPVQTSAVKPDAGARAIQRPDVDLVPPPPVPLLVLTWENGETPRRYNLEIDKDGSGRFLGEYNGCLTGEMTMDVPRATLEEARRIVLQSHVFDRPVRRCSSSPTDYPLFGIYFAEPPPGRKVTGELCREQRAVVKLARQLEKLLDLRGWIGKVEKCPS
jgi:hypothetical protein